jgi:two-component system chemotaxis response regulator CheB
MKKIRVLVVDDSLFYRKILSQWLSGDSGFEVVAVATDAFDAREKISQYSPDVITLDLEMPGMNGIEFLKTIMPRHPVPAVVICSPNERVFEALDAGAVDFLEKYNPATGQKLEAYIEELKTKLKIASVARLVAHQKSTQPLMRPGAVMDNKLIAIGASTGGTEALPGILKDLPPEMPGIVVVQHMPPVFTRMYAQRLDGLLKFHVAEARDGDEVRPGTVLIAPGDRHMRIEKAGGRYKVRCAAGEKVSGHCPSVDVLFESVALSAGRNAVGVILTGMGADGARGLLSMKQKGARTAGQDKDSCVVYGMPKVAFELGAVEQQAPLNKLPHIICSLVNG